jgi:hypothetical protein
VRSAQPQESVPPAKLPLPFEIPLSIEGCKAIPPM